MADCAGLRLWRVPPAGTAIAVLLFLIYIWTDFPIKYVPFGMVPYFLAIPLGLAATGAFARFLDRGGAGNWLFATLLMSLAFLVHFTTAMVAAPAASRGLRRSQPPRPAVLPLLRQRSARRSGTLPSG